MTVRPPTRSDTAIRRRIPVATVVCLPLGAGASARLTAHSSSLEGRKTRAKASLQARADGTCSVTAAVSASPGGSAQGRQEGESCAAGRDRAGQFGAVKVKLTGNPQAIGAARGASALRSPPPARRPQSQSQSPSLAALAFESLDFESEDLELESEEPESEASESDDFEPSEEEPLAPAFFLP